MIRTFMYSFLLFAVADICIADSFDLTSSVHGYDTSELAIDLGQAFMRIDSAYVRFEGKYTPGILINVSQIPQTPFAADDFHFLIRLDDPGTSWINKSVYAH